ncbi:hypothetical protein SAMN05443662_0036 [Sulfurivirga caldicuralii]|uniref:Nitrogen regulatory protein P-II family n=1 Tax=Sulfurivirga caldicuralii TaxID=364032 RepID=A0A1N6DCD7_9GAMM|nr:P-II family nitrogen regulator [Sulfurivirga caldicuralii]SIN68449.1 hypothetical protein SAMN05443662_0036 [Sulfurivirga caldicuralii]
MKFKLLIAIVDDTVTARIIDAAREAGATGATTIKSATGEGLQTAKTFFGLQLEAQRDVVLFVVEAHLARTILETIARAGEFCDKAGRGIVMQMDVEDIIGIEQQARAIIEQVEEDL